MKIKAEKSVCVITPTIGSQHLINAVESVDSQTYKNIKHLIVIDGPLFQNKVEDLGLDSFPQIQMTVAPENTGGNGFYGHRIYAGYPHLLNEDYIFFLDEDNWYEPSHVETMVDMIESRKYDWAYSLRNIFTKDGVFVTQDCCESLGKWPIFLTLDKPEQQYLVDTSSYAFKREFLVAVCQHWHSGWGGDRRFYHIISKLLKHENYHTTGLHTMNYRLDDDINRKYGSVSFFTDGNEAVKKHYGAYPWLKSIPSSPH